MNRIALLLLLCGSLAACSHGQEPQEIAVVPAPVPAPDTSFCQGIAQQHAAPHFTSMTQRGIYERSYAQCVWVFF